MFTKPRFDFGRAVLWTSEVIPIAGLWSGVLVFARIQFDLEWLQMPALPVGILGTATSFYLGFKGSAAYDRLWEARKVWGGIVNTSRTWGMFTLTFVTDRHVKGETSASVEEIRRELVYRHVAWLAALRTQLRRPKPWEHRERWNDKARGSYHTLDQSDERLAARMEGFISPTEIGAVMAQKNRAAQLIRRQGERLTELLDEGRIEDFRHMELARLLEEFYTLQGKCERIKNFPLPRQYASANHYFIQIFIAMLPFALIGAFSAQNLPNTYLWAVVPTTIVLAWVFWIWDRVLEYTENPFEGLVNDVPIDAMSRTIEIDLREMLGETELPPSTQAVDHILL